MARHNYKCYKCRDDKKKCEHLVFANTILGCERCLEMHLVCEGFGFKDGLNRARGTSGIYLSRLPPTLPTGDSTGGAIPYYVQLTLGCTGDSDRYVYDKSANESMVQSLVQLSHNRRIRATAMNCALLTAHEQEGIVAALEILDHVRAMMPNYRDRCQDAIREARHHRAISRNEEEGWIRESCQVFTGVATHENIGLIIGDVMQYMQATNAIALSTSKMKSLEAPNQLLSRDAVTPTEYASHAILLWEVMKILLESQNNHNNGAYCATLLAGRFQWPDALHHLMESYSGPLPCVDLHGRNIMHILADTGQAMALTTLLHRCPQIENDIRALVNVRDLLGFTPLAISAYRNDVCMFHVLLKLGANIWDFDHKGKSILFIAVRAESTAVVEACSFWFRQCMEYGTKSPLLEAAKRGNSAIVRVLIENNASPFWSRMPVSSCTQDQAIRATLEEYEEEWLQRGEGVPRTGDEIWQRMQQPYQSPEAGQAEWQSPALGAGSEHASSKPPPVYPPKCSRASVAPPDI